MAIVVCVYMCAAGLTCSNGELRLVDGRFSSEGRVEICLDEHFGTVCDDLWDNVDAQVVCRQLGFTAESKGQGVLMGGSAVPSVPVCNSFHFFSPYSYL